MAYATPSDLVERFGAQEIIRLTTPAGQDLDGVRTDIAERVLADTSAMMDSYIRRRYQTPISVVPDEIRRACLDIARYELSTGDGRVPSEEAKNRNDAAIKWLRDIASGLVVLELDEVAPGDESYAQTSVRGDVFGRTYP